MDRPVSVHVETFGTGDARLAEAFVRDHFDFRPEAIIERLGLRRPIYRSTTNYGHFGRPGLPWEESKKVVTRLRSGAEWRGPELDARRA